MLTLFLENKQWKFKTPGGVVFTTMFREETEVEDVKKYFRQTFQLEMTYAKDGSDIQSV